MRLKALQPHNPMGHRCIDTVLLAYNFDLASDLGHTTLDLPYHGHHHMEFDLQNLDHLDLLHFVSFA